MSNRSNKIDLTVFVMLLATCYAFPNIKGPPGLTSHTIDSVYKDKYQK